MDSANPGSTGTNNISPLGKVTILVILLVVAFGAWYFLKVKQVPLNTLLTQNTPQTTPNPLAEFFTIPPDKIILKVGSENIYQKDFDIELSAQPNSAAPKLKEIILNKLSEDSAILQGGAEEKLTTLDSTVFNSLTKDYKKRLLLISDIKKKLSAESDNITGTTVSIWFNNVTPGIIGYTQGKQTALEKITKIYNDVKDKKITITQAADQIKNDASLAKVDPAYKTNAKQDFQVNPGQTITFMSEFDALLWKLNPGELTPLYTGKDKDSKTGQLVDSLYTFGTVTSKISAGKIQSFENWLSAKLKQYATTTY